MLSVSRRWLLAWALFAVCDVALAAAHGEEAGEKGDMHKGHTGGMDHNASLNVPAHSDDADTYWRLTTARWLIYGHIILMVIDWILVLPVSIMFAVAKSNLHIPAQFVFLAINGFAIFLSILYNAQTPDLYPANAHHRMGWVAVAILTVQTVVGVIFSVAKSSDAPKNEEASSLMAAATARYQRMENRQGSWNSDSAHGGSDHSPSSRSPSLEEEPLYNHHEEQELKVVDEETKFEKLAKKYVPRYTVAQQWITIASVGYQISQRLLLIWTFMLIATGASTYTGVFKGGNIFTGLAHVIKGGIFFYYGIFTLGRYLGCFADLGWAWNVKPDASMVGKFRANIKSAEMVESALIFTYGFTNVWLEHLAGWGQAWHMGDLEHVSIAFWFLGGGLLGILTESERIRGLLNNVYSEDAQIAINQYEMAVPQTVFPEKPKFRQSMNVFPSLVIFMLGILMGSHHQEKVLGTMLHKQWGLLLSGAAVFRLGSFLLVFLKPPTSYLPSRPFTEPLAAFALMAGGLVFCLSNSETINAFDAMNVDGMFAFTLSLGITALLMSYQTLVIALKGWAVKREASRSHKSVFRIA
ncbi:hypothetical protein TWF192_004137 [Orbilia oligospora]|uniref:Integral membrane protein n=2 Tax=Orbilia oligospora TaxID=2813651 RepID=A0A6G1MN16_ORBOL|nr:hypothetical protein TWF679_007309 [Orbilia oligospora]KAF3216237.1 hypothetical protein TWF191_009066 [Orbilia oligospora]KAF3264455.1 hypothetical protein TWF192_004137 [Orbilia oligospora]